jgi:AraC-like DNA-binding protein
LKYLARQRGYSEGWAAHKYREIFNVWPANELRDCPAYEPTPDLLKWVKHTQIRYAKRRRAETMQPVSEVA